MIVLDTNVVSEPMRPQPDSRVVAWLDRQTAESLCITAVSVAELLVGMERLPLGRRRTSLETIFRELMAKLFGGRVLPFDEPAARAYPALLLRSIAGGATFALADGQIAAITMSRGFTLATRDVKPFAAGGVPIINPWQA